MMINTAYMPIYANRMNRMHFMGKKENKQAIYEQKLQEIQGKYPITYEALKLAEAEKVKNIILLTVDENADLEEFDDTTRLFKVGQFSPNDLQALKKSIKACEKGEWQVEKSIKGSQNVIYLFIRDRLKDHGELM